MPAGTAAPSRPRVRRARRVGRARSVSRWVFWLLIQMSVRCSVPPGNRSTTARPGVPPSRAVYCVKAWRPFCMAVPLYGHTARAAPPATAVLAAVRRSACPSPGVGWRATVRRAHRAGSRPDPHLLLADGADTEGCASGWSTDDADVPAALSAGTLPHHRGAGRARRTVVRRAGRGTGGRPVPVGVGRLRLALAWPGRPMADCRVRTGGRGGPPWRRRY